ncbi:MAG: hypothetical protein K8R40_03575, partial [Anaerolineaceae bacterium]|nr:hypothetical protein [Anaerolineaceae bacterium]
AIKEKKRDLPTIPTLAGENVRYVVPQKIIKDNLAEKDINLQLRVKKPIETPVRIQITNGQEVIAKKSEPYARPGEMITVKLRSKYYDQVKQATSLTVDVIER